MSKLKSLTLFCSAREVDPLFGQEAEQLMQFLSEHDVELVYGGSLNGLMGVAADHMLKYGGKVRGIIAECLHAQELAHLGIQVLEVVPDLMERKRRMLARGDVILALPGGIGTLDELLEAMTLSALNTLPQPIVLWNIRGFWDPFLDLLKHFEKEGMLHPASLERFHVLSSTPDLLGYLKQQLG